jgi:hypothetical protein
MARVLKREAAKRDLVAQWVWYAENADIVVAESVPERSRKDTIAARVSTTERLSSSLSKTGIATNGKVPHL